MAHSHVTWFSALALLLSGTLAGFTEAVSLTNTVDEFPVLTNKWAVPINSHSDCTPAIGPDGCLYLGTFEGKLWAIEAGGTVRWTYSLGREIRSSPALASDGTVYFGSRNHRFYALDKTGHLKWDFKTEAWVDSSPAVGADDSVYFGSWDRNLYALSKDGKLLWKYATGGPIVSSPALAADGTVYIGSHDQELHALRPGGQLAWKFRTGGAVISSPAIDESGVIYFTSVDGFFYALNPNGTQRWRLRTGGYTDSSPVIGKDGVLHVGVNTNVVAISSKGEKLSSRQMHDLILGSPLVFADGSWCAISRYGLLVGETAGKTSSERTWLWSYYTYGSGYSSPVAGADGTIYVYGKQQGMALIALEANQPLAKTPWPKFRKNFQNTAR